MTDEPAGTTSRQPVFGPEQCNEVKRAVPIRQCSAALGLTSKQLRTLIAQGAPTVRAGRPGRGGAALLDPDAVRVWMTRKDRNSIAEHQQLAASIVNTIAESLELQFRTTTGPHKRYLVLSMFTQFVSAATAVRAGLGLSPPPPQQYPRFIRKLAQLVG